MYHTETITSIYDPDKTNFTSAVQDFFSQHDYS